MAAKLESIAFASLDATDPFFDSLEADYKEFPEWFAKKSDDVAYVLKDGSQLVGFMYLKVEDGAVDDVLPAMAVGRRLKIGTLKIEAHGTRLGQRFVKKALDHAIYEGVAELYVTIFPRHEALIALLKEFGFLEHGTKTTPNGTEMVLTKALSAVTGYPRLDYPRFHIAGNRKFILPIWPEWHTQLFPDSILTNESYDVVADVAHTNSIEKSYICFMDASEVGSGDLLVVYRTSDDKGPAEYRSVVTSVCTVEEVRYKSAFSTQEDFCAYAERASVFSTEDLRKWWAAKYRNEMVVLRMLYNAALTKRLIRKTLVEEVGIDRDAYPGFLELTDKQLKAILELGGVHAGLVID